MRIREVLNEEGKFVYEELDGKMVLARIIRHDGKYYEMGKKTISDGALSVTDWYEYSDKGPVKRIETEVNPNE